MKRMISRVLLGLMAALFVAVNARAAGINSAEQRVLDAASQPFSYNGKTYVVNRQNISRAKVKLEEDSMDLTDGFANDCINQFHQSYAELVDGGYCEEVDVEKSDDAASPVPDATPSPKHSKSERERNKAFLKQFFGDPPELSSEGKAPVKDSEERSSKTKEEKTETTEKISPSPSASPDEWADEEDLLAAMEFDSEDMKNAVEKQLTVVRGDEKYAVQATEDKAAEGRRISGYLSLWKKFLAVLGIVTAVTAAVMADYVFASKGRHDRRKKKRSGLAVLAGTCIACWSFLVLLALSLNFGAFSKGTVRRQLMESDYFSGVTQMARKQAAMRLEDNGYDGSIADEVFVLSNVYIDEKQYIDAVLSGKKNAEISIDKIHERLTEQLAEKENAALIRLIEEDYKNICEFDFGRMIRGGRDAFRSVFYLTVIPGIVALLLLFVLVYLIYRRMYKAAGVGAAGLFPASLAAVSMAAVVGNMIFRQKWKVRPVYYQEFLQNYIRWDIRVVFCFGCIGLLCAGSLLVWRYHLRRLYGK